jgi:hypothetical protein
LINYSFLVIYSVCKHSYSDNKDDEDEEDEDEEDEVAFVNRGVKRVIGDTEEEEESNEEDGDEEGSDEEYDPFEEDYDGTDEHCRSRPAKRRLMYLHLILHILFS